MRSCWCIKRLHESGYRAWGVLESVPIAQDKSVRAHRQRMARLVCRHCVEVPFDGGRPLVDDISIYEAEHQWQVLGVRVRVVRDISSYHQSIDRCIGRVAEVDGV